MIRFRLNVKTVAGQNAREHWRKRAKRVKRERSIAWCEALVALRSQGVPFGTSRLVVTMTRLSAGKLDDDNLSGSCKAIRDGIADALGIDDASPAVRWAYAQQTCARGEYGVEVTIEGAPQC